MPMLPGLLLASSLAFAATADPVPIAVALTYRAGAREASARTEIALPADSADWIVLNGTTGSKGGRVLLGRQLAQDAAGLELEFLFIDTEALDTETLDAKPLGFRLTAPWGKTVTWRNEKSDRKRRFALTVRAPGPAHGSGN